MKSKRGARGLRLAIATFCFVTLLVSFGWTQNLLNNPGFETGDFTGWTVSGNSTNYGVNIAGFLIMGTDERFGPTYVVVNSGTYAGYTLVCAGCYPPPYGEYLELSQSVSLSPGNVYAVGVWVADGSTSGGYGDSVNIFVDGNQVQLTSHPVIEPGYQFVGGSFIALHNSSAISFLIDGSGIGVAGFSFDDLTLTLVGPASNGGYAYVVTQSADTVSSYEINSYTGVLTPGTGSPFPTGSGPVSVVSRGVLVYVADQGSSQVSGYATDLTTGNMTQVSGSPYAAGLVPSAVSLNSWGHSVYAAGLDSTGNGAISGWTFTATGVLTPIPGSPFPAGSAPGQMAFSFLGAYAYVVDAANDQLLAYTVNSTTGALSEFGTYPTGSNPSAVVSDRTGKYLYVSNAGDNNITAYQIGSGGALTPLTGSPFPAGTAPLSLALTSGFLYAVNSGSNNISGYQIDGSTGILTSINGSPFTCGTAPNSITNARGGFIYANTTGGIWGYTSDPTSGLLTVLPGSPFSGQGTAITSNGSGQGGTAR